MNADQVLTDLDAALHEVDAAEDHLLRMQQSRDALIVLARGAGSSAADLATRTGLSIQRIYQILGVPRDVHDPQRLPFERDAEFIARRKAAGF